MLLLRTVGLSLLLCSYQFSSAQDDAVNYKLQQLHVITRHGSRTPLAKDANNLAEVGGELLTPLGQKQLYDMGAWLRETYYSNLTNGDLHLGFYNPSKHRLESSNLDRTLSSAYSLAMGLFPSTKRASGLVNVDGSDSEEYLLYDSLFSPPPSVPIYTMKLENDVYARASQNCPTFLDNLQALYETDEWKELESANSDLLRTLAGIFPEYVNDDGIVPLESLWNAYDRINVAVTECGTSIDNITGSCAALVTEPDLGTAVTPSQFKKMEQLTDRTEHMKYGNYDVAGNLLGSNLWWKILSRTEDLSGEFFLYSAHVATILGLLSTLQAGPAFIHLTRGEHFVEYGSALIIEIYHDASKDASKPGQDLYIKMRYKESDESEAVDITLMQTLPSAKDTYCGASGWPTDTNIPPYCSLSNVIAWAKQHTLVSEADWCRACGNEVADVCLLQILEDLGVSLGDDDGSVVSNSSLQGEQGSSSSGGTEPWVVGTTFAGGFLAGLIVVGLVSLWFRRCDQKRDSFQNPTTVVAKVIEDDNGAIANADRGENEYGGSDSEAMAKEETLQGTGSDAHAHAHSASVV